MFYIWVFIFIYLLQWEHPGHKTCSNVMISLQYIMISSHASQTLWVACSCTGCSKYAKSKIGFIVQ